MNCNHQSAEFRCPSCVERVRSRIVKFPLQAQRDVPPGPHEIPWEVAEKAWNVYAAKYGTSQSVERMAQRGGFGWGEMDMLHPGWRAEVDEVLKLKAELESMKAQRPLELQSVAEAVRREIRKECPEAIHWVIDAFDVTRIVEHVLGGGR